MTGGADGVWPGAGATLAMVTFNSSSASSARFGRCGEPMMGVKLIDSPTKIKPVSEAATPA